MGNVFKKIISKLLLFSLILPNADVAGNGADPQPHNATSRKFIKIVIHLECANV